MPGTRRGDRNEIFWSKVKIGKPDECWPWIGYVVDTGHGRFTYTDGPIGEGLQVKAHAHRYAYEVSAGKINGMIDQTCGNILCCNPAHLEDVDRREMVRRRRVKKSAQIAQTT